MSAQRLQALALANVVRSRRSDLKADMRMGRIKLAEVLLSDADCCARCESAISYSPPRASGH